MLWLLLCWMSSCDMKMKRHFRAVQTLMAYLAFCSAAETAGTVSFSADLSSPRSPFPHTWEECVGSGHAALALRQDWREQLATVRKDLGFKRVRFHGVLDDDMGVVLPNGTYSFDKVDSVYDAIVSLGMYPYVELSFMPDAIASGNQTYLHYKANVTPPKSYVEWGKLIQSLGKHWLQRYGEESVSQWYIEVWNEPNLITLAGGFWDGSQEQYFELYQYTVTALKQVSSAFRVGGPASAKGGWLLEFMTFCIVSRLPLDFVSTHHYPTDEDESLMEEIKESKILVGGEYPLIISEYNSGLYLLEDNHDTNFAAAFVAHSVPQVAREVTALSYWTFSDIFEEIYFDTVPFHDGFGMLTVDGIPKAAYRAFQLMHNLSNVTIATQWTPGNVSSVTATVCVEPSNTTIQVLLSNFAPPKGPAPQDYNISCLLQSLPTQTTPTVTMSRVSETEANARATWEAMGRPITLTPQQKEELMVASEVKPVPLPFKLDPSGHSLSFSTFLPFRSMAMVRISLDDTMATKSA